MGVKFTWKGSVDDAAGLALYETADSAYELWLPSFAKAKQLDGVLRDVLAEGRRLGHREMMQGVSNALNDVARKL